MQPTKENIDPNYITSPKVTLLRLVFCLVFIWGGGVQGFKLFMVKSTGRSIDCVMTVDQSTSQSTS